jgi:phospholipid/cholesterol/gamma-HCH transport system substrate-binding protein
MRRIAGIVIALAALALILVVGTGSAADDDGTYEVRALFDNGSFLVPGEEVRIAGARVGTVSDVHVTGTEEQVRADGSPEPGKAAITLRIDDPAFQDFRVDASCLIRPQSLLGEKFVECDPTQPRAPGTEAPPELEVIGEGEVGEGERFLPLEANGKAVDLDLVNNIMKEPYPDRFRLIINDLGAGLAARGEDLAEIVERANPALRETNEVLAILADQNRSLADLARDADTVLTPLAREGDRISGFISSAGDTAAATAERGADLEQGLSLLPATLREVRSTMGELQRFADAGTPLFRELAAAAPATVRATQELGPFTRAATTSLSSLGDAAQESQQPLVESDPVIRQIRSVAKSAAPAASNGHKLLRSLDRKDGFRNALRFVYRGAGAFNGFDNLGHFARAFLLITNCNDYITAPQTGCIANFLPPIEDTETKARERRHAGERQRRASSRARSEESGGTVAELETGEAHAPAAPTPAAPVPTSPGTQTVPGSTTTTPADSAEPTEPASTTEEPATEPAGEVDPAPAKRVRVRDVEVLLEFLIGERQDRKRRASR